MGFCIENSWTGTSCLIHVQRHGIKPKLVSSIGSSYTDTAFLFPINTSRIFTLVFWKCGEEWCANLHFSVKKLRYWFTTCLSWYVNWVPIVAIACLLLSKDTEIVRWKLLFSENCHDECSNWCAGWSCNSSTRTSCKIKCYVFFWANSHQHLQLKFYFPFRVLPEI